MATSPRPRRVAASALHGSLVLIAEGYGSAREKADREIASLEAGPSPGYVDALAAEALLGAVDRVSSSPDALRRLGKEELAHFRGFFARAEAGSGRRRAAGALADALPDDAPQRVRRWIGGALPRLLRGLRNAALAPPVALHANFDAPPRAASLAWCPAVALAALGRDDFKAIKLLARDALEARVPDAVRAQHLALARCLCRDAAPPPPLGEGLALDILRAFWTGRTCAATR
ncbi:hypothetical protein JL720_13635 [Aureococcus anophagefferens]|nr:hypothetical protein JL720_13635 [Aureococcus anophagefferens]